MNASYLPRFFRAALIGCVAASGALAQQAATPSATQPAAPEEVLVLSPFQVDATRDRGYKATNSVSGTRLNMSIRDVPLNLEVITADFIRDTGSNNLREALRYSAGVVLESQSDIFDNPDGDWSGAGANDPRGVTRRAGDSTVKLRGFVIDQVLRDGFRRQYSADSLNIDRIEVVRGPAALLYGVGSFGGVINYLPKRPSQKAEYSGGVTVGSDDFFRAQFEASGPLGANRMRPAFRVSGVHQTRGDYTEYFKAKHTMLAPSFSLRPFRQTEILVDNEIGYTEQTGIGFQNLRSNVNTAVSRVAGWLTDASGGRIDTRTFRWSGPDTYEKGPFNNHVLDLTQGLGRNLTIKAGYSYSRAVFDSRQIRETGTRTDPFVLTAPTSYYPTATVTIAGASQNLRNALTQAGASGTFGGLTASQIAALAPPAAFRGDRLYGFIANDPVQNQVLEIPGPPQTANRAAVRYEWNDQDRVETRDQVRIDVNYRLDLGKWGMHNFIAGTQYMGRKNVSDQFGSPRSFSGGTNPDGTTFAALSVLDVDRFNYKNPEDYSPFRYGVQGDGLPDQPRTHLNHNIEKTWDLGYYGVYQGQFLRNRLTVIGGVRADRNDRRLVEQFVNQTGRAPLLTERVAAKAPSATSPQFGLSYKVNRAISIFGLQSTGVVPNYRERYGDGQPFEPTKAKNREVGLKFDLFEGRISGTVSAYKIERRNTPKELWWAPAPYKSIQNGYNPSRPTTAPWSHPNPESLWYAIRNTPNGLRVAKEIWPQVFHSVLDHMATIPAGTNAYTPTSAFYQHPDIGAGGARWWSYDLDANGKRGLMRESEIGWGNGTFNGGYYFPLVNISNPEHLAFAKAGKLDYTGWGGNWFYTPGRTYYLGDGTASVGNAPSGVGAHVPINDEAKGWDLSVIFSPNDRLQIVANYARLERQITTPTYKFVPTPYWPFGEYFVRDGFFGTFGYQRSVAEAYADPTNVTTYRAPIPEYQQSYDDSPKNSASVWVRYSLANFARLKNFSVGAGGYWEDKRLWFTGYSGNNIVTVDQNADGVGELVQLWTKDRITLDGYIEYRTTIAEKYNLRLSLNVNNVLDDQGRYGAVYASGRSWRLAGKLDF